MPTPKSRPLRTDTRSFKRWFDGSKVVTDAGAPLVVFHGTPNAFTTFDTFPAYFTCDRDAAMAYAESQYARDDHEGVPTVMELYLALKNPKIIYAEELAIEAPDDDGGICWMSVDNYAFQLEKLGYDGMILKGVNDFSGMDGDLRQTRAYDQYVAFNAKQIKIAVAQNPNHDKEHTGPEL